MTQSNADYARIETAIRYLERNFRVQPSLAKVAAQVHLSEYHFQRLFRRWAGISPKRFLQFLTADYARELLGERHNVLDVSSAAGLSGGGRLHDLLVNLYAMTPGEVKAGGADLVIDYGFHPGPFGECLIAMTARGVCGIEFIARDGRTTALARLRAQWPHATWRSRPNGTRAVAQHLFAGRGRVDLCVQGSNFQVKVWEALLRIPSGRVASYADVAASIEVPTASRAVASAIARNPVALLIPCHRVIRSTGAFGDYRWGSARKKAILGWEAARIAPQENE